MGRRGILGPHTQTPLLPVTSLHKHMEPLSQRQGECIYLLFHFALGRSPHFTILYSAAQCDTGHGNSIPIQQQIKSHRSGGFKQCWAGVCVCGYFDTILFFGITFLLSLSVMQNGNKWLGVFRCYVKPRKGHVLSERTHSVLGDLVEKKLIQLLRGTLQPRHNRLYFSPSLCGAMKYKSYIC